MMLAEGVALEIVAQGKIASTAWVRTFYQVIILDSVRFQMPSQIFLVRKPVLLIATSRMGTLDLSGVICLMLT